jgi:hypothetical protein
MWNGAVDFKVAAGKFGGGAEDFLQLAATKAIPNNIAVQQESRAPAIKNFIFG